MNLYEFEVRLIFPGYRIGSQTTEKSCLNFFFFKIVFGQKFRGVFSVFLLSLNAFMGDTYLSTLLLI